jgi:hypothetical protein
MSLACCTSRIKEWERTETPNLEELNSPIKRQQQKTHFTKSDLMKSIFSDSAVLAASRCIGFVAVMVLAALPAIGAGSANQAVRKDSDPSITLYNQGIELMLAKRFLYADAASQGTVVWRLPGTKEGAEEINQSFNQIDQHEKEIAH